MSEFNSIITIGREYVAGGRTIAKRISEILGIPYYDKDIIKLTAEKTGFSEEMIHDTEETSGARSIFNWLMPIINWLCVLIGWTLKDLAGKPFKKSKKVAQ